MERPLDGNGLYPLSGIVGSYRFDDDIMMMLMMIIMMVIMIS